MGMEFASWVALNWSWLAAMYPDAFTFVCGLAVYVDLNLLLILISCG